MVQDSARSGKQNLTERMLWQISSKNDGHKDWCTHYVSRKGDLHDNSYNVNAAFHGTKSCESTMSAQDGDLIPK